MNNNQNQAQNAIGFTVSNISNPESIEKCVGACNTALAHCSWLMRKSIQHGDSVLEIWGHRDIGLASYVDSHNNLFLLVGSPSNVFSWEEVIDLIDKHGELQFSLPWEGRCLLIKISPDGKDWWMWNDWAGSVPVFHAELDRGCIASTFEPVVVAGAQLTSNDFSKRGVVELLTHGQFLGTDTLYERVKVLAADTCSQWRSKKFLGSKRLWTITPTEDRWHDHWDDLTEAMYEHTFRIIKNAFGRYERCLLPLSGGMDSRLIAIVLRELNFPLSSYTYGHEDWNETVYAQKVAQALDIPWQRIELGTNYLNDYTKIWFDLFGSSLHAHGMYQISFLKQIESEEGVVPDGWYGNNLAGGNHPSKILLSDTESTWRGFYKGYGSFWPVEDLKKILSFDPLPYIEQMKEVIAEQVDSVKNWPYYHRMNAVDMWNRQQRFVFYQPHIYDLWKTSVTPFMDREYARFCFSLPIKALDIRLLQRKMLKRYWPKIAEIPGTYEQVSFSNNAYFKIKGIAMKIVPWRYLVGLVRMLGKVPNTMDVECVQFGQWKALYPLTPSFDGSGIFNTEQLQKTFHRALHYSSSDYSKTSAVQPIAYRMLADSSRKDIDISNLTKIM